MTRRSSEWKTWGRGDHRVTCGEGERRARLDGKGHCFWNWQSLINIDTIVRAQMDYCGHIPYIFLFCCIEKTLKSNVLSLYSRQSRKKKYGVAIQRQISSSLNNFRAQVRVNTATIFPKLVRALNMHATVIFRFSQAKTY